MAAHTASSHPIPPGLVNRSKPGRKRDALLLSAADACALLNINEKTFKQWWNAERGGWVIPTEGDPRGLFIRAVPVGTDKRVSRPRLELVLRAMNDQVES